MMTSTKEVWYLLCLSFLISCGTKTADTEQKEIKTIGTIERIENTFNELIDENATIEIISEGYEWSEGPLWVPAQNMLLFSDVPKNIVYKWTEAEGTSVYLSSSGYTGTLPAESREPGANGLTLDPEGRLTLCQQGNRFVAVMNTPTSNPSADYTPIAELYEGKKFNSPNDAIYSSQGDLYFTDPPYGLRKQEEDPGKEIPFQGVYKVSAGTHEAILLVDSLTRPNGIILTPDEKTLIIANSDPKKSIWYAFDLGENNTLTNARIFYDATGSAGKGLPDGLKVDKQGNIFASGPGGVWIFNKEGTVLGKIKVPDAAANTALSPDEKTLYITNDMYVLRVKMR